MNPKKIALVACSPSSDELGARLIQGLQSINPNIKFIGLGGEKMESLGFKSFFDIHKLSIMGFNGIIFRYLEIKKLQKQLIDFLTTTKIELFIGIDSYGFNIKIHEILKSKGTKTVQYVSPQVWAWRQNRINKIKKHIDLVLTLFPFEKEFYAKFNIPAYFVGHPFANEIPLEPIKTSLLRKKYGIKPKDTVIGVLPGSRHSDLKYMVPVFIKTIKKILLINPEIKFFIPVPTEKLKSKLISILNSDFSELNIYISLYNAREIISLSDIVLTKSGTSTLETMLLKKPMVVVWKGGLLTYMIAKHLVKLPYIALPNILANKKIVNEFIQNNATPESLSSCIFSTLDKNNSYLEFKKLHEELKTKNTNKIIKIINSLIMSKNKF